MAQLKQFFTYVPSCLDLAILIKMSINNPSDSQKSGVLESSAKVSLGCHFGSPGLV